MLFIEMPWSRNSCHNACSAWASLKWAGGASARRSPCSGCVTVTSGAGGAAWDVEASASCAEHCDITQPSCRITSTSCARSGADPGRPLDWPYPGGASPSAAASAGLWSLTGRLSERAYSRPWGGAWGTSAYDIVVVASSCCRLVAAAVTRGGSPVASALAAVRGALSECRLVVASVPNLSALAGMRAGMVGVTLSAKK
jgi:hypothetical protein